MGGARSRNTGCDAITDFDLLIMNAMSFLLRTNGRAGCAAAPRSLAMQESIVVCPCRNMSWIALTKKVIVGLIIIK